AVFTGASVLLRSAGLALVAGMVARAVTVLARDRRRGLALLGAFTPALIVGLGGQVAWMHQQPAPLRWPELPGYPWPYLSQLKVVSGNQPQLGMVTARGIPVRIARRLFERSNMLVQFLLGRQVHSSSPLSWSVLLLLLSGWGYSVWKGRWGA